MATEDSQKEQPPLPPKSSSKKTRHKIIVLGDAGVGKSSLVATLCGDNWVRKDSIFFVVRGSKQDQAQRGRLMGGGGGAMRRDCVLSPDSVLYCLGGTQKQETTQDGKGQAPGDAVPLDIWHGIRLDAPFQVRVVVRGSSKGENTLMLRNGDLFLVYFRGRVWSSSTRCNSVHEEKKEVQVVEGAAVALVCYDVTSLPSFEAAALRWRKKAVEDPRSVVVLVGLKVDCADLLLQRRVSLANAHAAAKEFASGGFVEVSALMGSNMLLLVEIILLAVHQHVRCAKEYSVTESPKLGRGLPGPSPPMALEVSIQQVQGRHAFARRTHALFEPVHKPSGLETEDWEAAKAAQRSFQSQLEEQVMLARSQDLNQSLFASTPFSVVARDSVGQFAARERGRRKSEQASLMVPQVRSVMVAQAAAAAGKRWARRMSQGNRPSTASPPALLSAALDDEEMRALVEEPKVVDIRGKARDAQVMVRVEMSVGKGRMARIHVCEGDRVEQLSRAVVRALALDRALATCIAEVLQGCLDAHMASLKKKARKRRRELLRRGIERRKGMGTVGSLPIPPGTHRPRGSRGPVVAKLHLLLPASGRVGGLVVREGDDPEDLAAGFAATFGLRVEGEQKITEYVRQVLREEIGPEPQLHDANHVGVVLARVDHGPHAAQVPTAMPTPKTHARDRDVWSPPKVPSEAVPVGRGPGGFLTLENEMHKSKSRAREVGAKICEVEIGVGHGQNILVIHEFSDPTLTARAFVAEHGLGQDMKEEIEQIVRECLDDYYDRCG